MGVSHPNSNLGLILGQVVSPSGYGASGATVLGAPGSHFEMFSVQDVETETDRDGFFALMFEWNAADYAADEGAGFYVKVYAETVDVAGSLVTTTAKGFTLSNARLRPDIGKISGPMLTGITPMKVIGMLPDADRALFSGNAPAALASQIKSMTKLSKFLSFLKDKPATELVMLLGTAVVQLK